MLLACIVCTLPCGAAEPPPGLLACRSISDPAARLACFDRETAPLETVPSAPTAPEHPQAAVSPQDEFGVSGSAIAAKAETNGAHPEKLSKIESKVVGLSLTASGRTVFTLENAQVWRQLGSDGDVLAKLGDSATITRGALGSYWLSLKSGRGCKVTRIR
jgi:hypothetical protein